MKKFVRRRGVLTTALSPYEVELLGSLVRQVVDLVSDGEPEGFATPDPTADAFEALTADLQGDPDEPEVSDDPVLRRLFPNAYPHDADASSDFRRFTERGLRTTKVVDARVVLDDLAATDEGSTDLRVRPDHVEAWLRTLTSVRLAVATRLGVTDAESADQLAQLDESDPRSYMVSVYDWLGFAQETMVGAL
jgi:hypothetical protein